MRPLQVARDAIRQRAHDPPEAAELGERRLQPLTERVLGRLPGKRWAWVAAWALVPWANAGMNLLLDTETKSAVWGQSGTVVILNYAALSFAVVMAIWGSTRIATQVEDLHGAAPFRELNSATAPLLGAVSIALAFGVSALVEDGPVAAILRAITWLIVGTALWTFLWTYVSLQVGLYRLGGERVTDAARMDPGLGLRPVGDVAFTGLWILLAWLVPLVLTGLSDVVGVAIGAAVLAAALTTFFLSLVRLHRQMVRVKAEELALARGLYAEAYEPVRTIATSVVAITIGRLILDPFGL